MYLILSLSIYLYLYLSDNNNNNWLPAGAYFYPYSTLDSFGALLRARLIWERYVSQALCRPYPHNPASGEVCVQFVSFQAILGSICTNLRVFFRIVPHTGQRYGIVDHAVR
jgi:hypothetical protein